MTNKRIRPYLAPGIVAACLLVLYMYGNVRAIRYCNCKNTEDWKPGEERSAARGSSGRSHFYHK
ncbi:hypothetical protein ACFOTA_01100 [Chitinophaga sp. GCM10012297]|uniref:Uncharacterized protein n=1 Tax=Chitinophaga chungangae TaxID=2821488 RepID=A0ABS3Y9H7_9BACT|nr:hypothetical protein [Chitinophaga chungangae]MBO9150789.1 hypothetical protein [Chitinophaga chungangae]